MDEKQMKMLIADMKRERQEIREKIFKLIGDAISEDDWDTVRKYGHYSADIAAAILQLYEDILSPEDKCRIALFHFSDKGDAYPVIRKYVRASIKYRPKNWRDDLPESVRNLDTFTVYRAGVEPIGKAQYSMSWTLSRDVAEWFAERQEYFGWGKSHLYKGVISADKVIAYLNGRYEFEIVQYRNVRQIEEIARRGPGEEFLSLNSEATAYTEEAIARKNSIYEDYFNKSLTLE